MEVIEIADHALKEEIARKILADLPEWFGIPESTENYITEGRELPFLACKEEDYRGFAVLKETGPSAAEIFVMGVLKKYRGAGMGAKLYQYLEAYARSKGYAYLQVKTVQQGHYKEYDETNAFYRAMGFQELECIPDLWDEWNPCQIYIKYIRS